MFLAVWNVGQLPADERTGQLSAELVEVVRAVPQSMVIRHRMEELLRVQCTSEQERQVAVRRLDDVRDGVHSLAPVERVLVCQSILETIGELYPRLESLRDPRQKRGIDDRRPPRTWGVRVSVWSCRRWGRSH